jgi:hypothetical protein
MDSKFLSENLCMENQLHDIGVNVKKSTIFGSKGLWCWGEGWITVSQNSDRWERSDESHVIQIININTIFRHNSVILLRCISYIVSFNMFRL